MFNVDTKRIGRLQVVLVVPPNNSKSKQREIVNRWHYNKVEDEAKLLIFPTSDSHHSLKAKHSFGRMNACSEKTGFVRARIA